MNTSVFDHYECEGQMSIFDFLHDNDLDNIPEEDMVAQIGSALGITFKYEGDFWGWVWKKGKVKMDCHYSNYYFDDHRRFIHIGVSTPTSGSSGPCDSIEEAINRGKAMMKSYELMPK